MTIITDLNAFLTFRNVAIPPNATIHKAILIFTARENSENELNTVDVVIRGHCSSNSDNFEDVSPWYPTASFVEWDDVEEWTTDVEYESPNIACIIQEIVAIDGWMSGNDLSLAIINDGSQSDLGPAFAVSRTAYDYSVEPTKATQLKIWYTLDFIEEPSGGVLVGGAATYVGEQTLEPSGGVLVGGAATYVGEQTLEPSGGVIVGGAATVTDTIPELFEDTPSGGCLVGGVAIVSSSSFDCNFLNEEPEKYIKCLCPAPNTRTTKVIMKFYYAACNRTNPQCDSQSGAYVPAITVCKQRLFLCDNSTSYCESDNG